MHKTAYQAAKPNDNYFKVVRGNDGDTPELFLYGYIGQQDFWGDNPEQDITDIAVVKAIRELENEGHKRINIRINSPGGSVMHGDPIITAIRQSGSAVHTYVDGIAASMAFDIWLSGKVRHAATNSKLMTHATSSVAIGTAKDMENAAAMLKAFDNSAIAVFSEATGMDEEEVRTRFYDYEDHWITAKDALEIGLIDKIDSYKTVTPIENPEKLTFRQLLHMAGKMSMKEPEPELEENGYLNEQWREDYLRRLQSL